MKKPQNKFIALPEPDRKLILDLCSKNPYDDVVGIVAKPRAEGGLDIITSAPALCRFYTSFHPDSSQTLLAQYAAAANIRHEQSANAFLGAIRANVEARVLENLRNGKALADMDKDFRFLKIAENLYLADAQWRTASPKAARAAYQRHVDRSATAPETDFIPASQSNADPAHLEVLDAPSEFDLDIIKSRERQQREEEARRELLASFQAADSRTQNLPNITRPRPADPKTPVIPHIPPDSTHSPAPTSHHPAATPEKKPVPYVAPPKAGRNDPCPCGSGRKSKKCCAS